MINVKRDCRFSNASFFKRVLTKNRLFTLVLVKAISYSLELLCAEL